MPQSVRPEVLRDLIEAVTNSQRNLDVTEEKLQVAKSARQEAYETHDRAMRELENSVGFGTVIHHSGGTYMIRDSVDIGLGRRRLVAMPTATTDTAPAVVATPQPEAPKPAPAPPAAAKPVVTPPAPPASAPPANPPKANPVQSQKKP
jgi:hypothetical protein